ncbi:MAG: calcium/sodium antiporter [Planctomycetaceae bacterium]|nr:calcium/sodium antiporter [Planctomycetales bacterium]MCB9924303.1 calcium/sodium antiporter [Planctomycetaceae bacterium]
MDDLFWAWLGICLGLVLLVGGGELLVRGASQLATAVRISPLVIGLTVVAFGTSAPELAVSVQAAFAGSADLAIGNVVGSNIFNVLFILGLSAMIVPLVVSSRLIRWDVPVMIGVSLLLPLLGWNGNINRLEGAMLFAGIIAYTWWCIRQSRKESREVLAEFEKESTGSEVKPRALLMDLVAIVAGLLLLGVGSRLLIDGSVKVASSFGISELIIGLTIIAAGTSLPEVVTSIVAAVRGQRDIAVGNVVGSNIFNVLCVLGLSSLIVPTGVEVSNTAFHFDIPVMIVVAVACLPIFMTGHVIARWEGGLFFVYFLAYTTYIVLHATHNDLTHPFRDVMLLFVVPMTAVTLVITSWRALRHRS